MSRAWRASRARLFAGSRAGEAQPASRELVGCDFVRPAEATPHRTGWGAALVGALLAALVLAALHVQVTRQRYALGQALESETRLLRELADARARVSELRDPARLHREAGRLGLARPERVLEIELPPLPPAGRVR